MGYQAKTKAKAKGKGRQSLAKTRAKTKGNDKVNGKGKGMVKLHGQRQRNGKGIVYRVCWSKLKQHLERTARYDPNAE